MKTLNLKEMEAIEGGLTERGRTATGYMCGMAVTLLFTGAFAPLAAAPGLGCALGLYLM